MQIAREATEAEMVALFLASELHSDRWREPLVSVLSEYGLSADLIEHANISSSEENRLRAAVLARFRGYGENRSLFEGYPAGVRWCHTVLDAPDIPRLKYIDYSYWNEISGGTRRPLDAVATIRAGTEIFEVPNDPFHEGVRHLRRGGTFLSLILVTPDTDCDLAILEGHVRATVYALVDASNLGPIEAMVGFHEMFRSWV